MVRDLRLSSDPRQRPEHRPKNVLPLDPERRGTPGGDVSFFAGAGLAGVGALSDAVAYPSRAFIAATAAATPCS
jgi:hypothetical protein